MLRRLFLVASLLLILGNIQVAFAHDVMQGDQCVIAPTDHIVGNVFAFCGTLTVSGEIDGNLIGGGSTILIDGTVNGSVYLVGGQLDISGTIGKDIHFAGVVLNVEPSAQLIGEDSDLFSLSLSTHVDTARIPGSVTSASYQLVLDGPVNREVSFWGSALTLNSTVGGDVTATVGDPASTGVTELSTLFSFLPLEADLVNPGLIVGRRGGVDGTLRYSGPVSGDIQGTLLHPAEFTPVTNQPAFIAPEKSFLESLREYLAAAVREWVALALVGVVGLLVARRTLQAPIYSLRVRPLVSLGIGLVTFIISFPIFFIVVPLLGAVLVLLLLLLQLSDLALIAAAIVFVLDLGGMGLFYFTAIFVSRVIVCIALGRVFVRLLLGERPERYMTYVSLLFGAIFLALITSLPYMGLVVNALAAFFGLGAMLTLIRRQLDIAREAAPPEPTYPEEARQLPPPAIPDKALAPGMENLPDGFKWWK